GVVKVTPGVAWQVFESVAIGATLNVLYSSLKQRIFPNTSVVDASNPSHRFFGTSIENASSVRVGAKFVALFKPRSDLSLGITYAPEVKIPFDNGKLVANFSALGLGTVTYHDVHLAGLALPKEIAAGIAWQATQRLLLAFDLMWSDY